LLSASALRISPLRCPGIAYGKLRNSRGHVLTNHRRSAFFIPHFTLRITQFRILPIANTERPCWIPQTMLQHTHTTRQDKTTRGHGQTGTNTNRQGCRQQTACRSDSAPPATHRYACRPKLANAAAYAVSL